MQRIVANQAEEEGAKANDRNRQRMVRIRAAKTSEQPAIRREDSRLRAWPARSADRNRMNATGWEKMNEKQQIITKVSFTLSYHVITFALNSRTTQLMTDTHWPYDWCASILQALKFNGETTIMCYAVEKLNCLCLRTVRDVKTLRNLSLNQKLSNLKSGNTIHASKWRHSLQKS